MSPSASPVGDGRFTVGDVLSQLKPVFTDLTISKIRFLEAEGLVRPSRSPSGYRKFSDADVARLRYVLTQQKDHYLPLKRSSATKLRRHPRSWNLSRRTAAATSPRVTHATIAAIEDTARYG